MPILESVILFCLLEERVKKSARASHGAVQQKLLYEWKRGAKSIAVRARDASYVTELVVGNHVSE
ncbi:MAG: hypothetical protein IAI48_06030 [Candidatus Eremiobacteraeota bacterium]|nr:hypothetical protein [Candidatus Eremiobacteraeota bacterium]